MKEGVDNVPVMRRFIDVAVPVKTCNLRCHYCYNAHVFLALGAIAGRSDPSYATLRNKVCADGSEWLRPRMKAFLSQKLDRNNVPKTMVGRLVSDFHCLIVVAFRLLTRLGYRVFRKRDR